MSINWKRFLFYSLKMYVLATELRKYVKIRAAILKNIIGEEGLEIQEIKKYRQMITTKQKNL